MPDFKNPTTLTLQVNKKIPAKRFLSSFFAPEYLLTHDAEIDVVEGSRTVAPFKREGGKSTVSNRAGYGKAKVHCYEIDLKRHTNAFDVFQVQPGEIPVNSGMSANQRANYILGQDTFDLSNQIQRAIERMCSQAMFEGKYDILDEEGKKIDNIDFGLKETHGKTASTLWGSAGADVIGDLEYLDNIVGEDSGATVTDKVFGSIAWSKARGDKNFMKDFDRIHVGGNSLDFSAGRNGLGARLVGFHNGSRIWVYDEVYYVGNDKFNFVPKTKVLAISDSIAAKIKYGAVGNIKDGFFSAERFSRTYWDDDNEEQILQMKSRPLAVIQEIDALAWMTVAAEPDQA